MGVDLSFMRFRESNMDEQEMFHRAEYHHLLRIISVIWCFYKDFLEEKSSIQGRRKLDSILVPFCVLKWYDLINIFNIPCSTKAIKSTDCKAEVLKVFKNYSFQNKQVNEMRIQPTLHFLLVALGKYSQKFGSLFICKHCIININVLLLRIIMQC